MIDSSRRRLWGSFRLPWPRVATARISTVVSPTPYTMPRTAHIAALLTAGLAFASPARAAVPTAVHAARPPAVLPAFPAAGPLAVSSVIARTEPRDTARRIVVVHAFRPDFRPQYLLAIAGRRDAHGQLWVQVRLQLRPNGTLGWIPRSAVQLTATRDKIVVHRGRRKIDIFANGKLVDEAPVAIGAPGRETPLGNFYVTARFVPDDPFLGTFAVATSAYSKLTEWPGGGVVGIHGTSAPQLLGQAVSHGCVRVSNATAALLRRYAPVGTPISIVAN
jgi:lipoprotein-anchoring transpeptidase ErfK/SrfK